MTKQEVLDSFEIRLSKLKADKPAFAVNPLIGKICESEIEAYEIVVAALRGSIENEWVSVEERLPENLEDVLLWDGCDIMKGFWDSIDKNFHSTDLEFYENVSIKYWKPLPNPPEVTSRD